MSRPRPEPYAVDPSLLRPATAADLPALRELIALSVRSLGRARYDQRQIESALRYLFGPDTQLIEDGTYFVVEDGSEVVGCGGWSRRATLYGGDQSKPADDPLLDAARDAARIRAFFVHPAHARRGIATRILDACMDAAWHAGFRRLELMATLPGVPLYRRFGFLPGAPVRSTLPDGVVIEFVPMSRPLLHRPPADPHDPIPRAAR